jgi:hypothetical protein
LVAEREEKGGGGTGWGGLTGSSAGGRKERGMAGLLRGQMEMGYDFFFLFFIKGATKPTPLKRILSSRFGKIGKQLRELCNQLIFSFPCSFIL